MLRYWREGNAVFFKLMRRFKEMINNAGLRAILLNTMKYKIQPPQPSNLGMGLDSYS